MFLSSIGSIAAFLNLLSKNEYLRAKGVLPYRWQARFRALCG